VSAANLLLVEDEALNRELVKAIVSRSADPWLRTARLAEAATLAEARAALARERIDVVLLDVQLPDGSGLSLAGELSRRGDGRPVIVAMTAGALAEQRDAALAAGCDAVLLKPYTVAEFEATLAPYLTGPAGG
jgi:two-component system KDP operon response regulator KdpE